MIWLALDELFRVEKTEFPSCVTVPSPKSMCACQKYPQTLNGRYTGPLEGVAQILAEILHSNCPITLYPWV